MALTDGFTRTRIATLRSFGFGFFIGLSLERRDANFAGRGFAGLGAGADVGMPGD
jgi:hypothetical protein